MCECGGSSPAGLNPSRDPMLVPAQTLRRALQEQRSITGELCGTTATPSLAIPAELGIIESEISRLEKLSYILRERIDKALGPAAPTNKLSIPKVETPRYYILDAIRTERQRVTAVVDTLNELLERLQF